MKGNVLGFDPNTGTGAISGYDGKRYEFATPDWHGGARPARGDLVDFVPEDNRARQIYLLQPEYIPPTFGEFYFSPSGRISRSQYWLRFFLPVFVIGIALHALALGHPALRILPQLFQLLVLWPGIAILIKRIHDRNKSGWLVWVLYGPMIPLILLVIVTIIALAVHALHVAGMLGSITGALGIIMFAVAIWFFIEFGCMRGTIGVNRYGPDPVPRV